MKSTSTVLWELGRATVLATRPTRSASGGRGWQGGVSGLRSLGSCINAIPWGESEGGHPVGSKCRNDHN